MPTRPTSSPPTPAAPHPATGTAWRRQAACRDSDPELFYDIHGEPEPARRRRHQVAKGLCGRCPVRDACLAEVLTLEGTLTFGVRGGLTASERRRLLAGRPPRRQPRPDGHDPAPTLGHGRRRTRRRP